MPQYLNNERRNYRYICSTNIIVSAFFQFTFMNCGNVILWLKSKISFLYRVAPEVIQKEFPEIKYTTLKEYLIKHKDELAIGTEIKQ